MSDFNYPGDDEDIEEFNDTSRYDWYNDTEPYDWYYNNDDYNDEDDDEDDSDEDIADKAQDAKDSVDKMKKLSNKSGGSGGDPLSNFKNMFGKGGGSSANAGKAASKAAGKAASKAAGHAAVSAAGSGAGAAIAAALPYIGIALLIILIIVLIVAIVVGIVEYFNQATTASYMETNGSVTSEYFYGVRLAYINEEELTNSLQLSYKQYVIDVVENFEENNPSINITIELPEPTDGETFTNQTEIDAHITNLSLGIANIVATGANEYEGVDFATLYPQIEYFGLTTEQNQQVTDFVSDYIVSKSLFSTADEGVNVGDLIETTILDDTDLKYVLNRAEKVMIKDEIATEEGLSGIQQRVYVGSVYMPNKDLTIESLAYAIASDHEEVEISVKVVEKSGAADIIHLDEVMAENPGVYDGFTVDSVSLKQFTSIDTNNLEKYSVGVSLFEALKTGPQYFTKNADTDIYSWKPTMDGSLYLEFGSANEFIFIELDLTIQGAEQ